MTAAEKLALAVLEPFLGDELANDIIAHRRGMRAPLTARGARSLVKEYQATGNVIAAAEMHLNRGWRGFDHSWFKQPASFTDTANPTPKETAEERNRRLQLENDLRWARNEGDKPKEKQIRDLLAKALARA